MELVGQWIAANALQAIQGVGIIAGLLFTAASFRQNARVQRTATLISLTQQHRSIWMEVFRLPKLRRILNPKFSEKQKVTFDERLFVNLIILHLSSTLVAIRNGVIDKPSGVDEDLLELFSFPIPKKVWEESRNFRDEETVKYIDALLSRKVNS